MYVTKAFENTPPEGALLPQEQSAFDLLHQLHIPYTRVSSEPADTMEKCAEVSKVLGYPICKNLFLCNRQKTQFYLLTMPPDKPFLTKDLSHQIGSSRLSFAPPEKMEELLGCSPGSASVLGLHNDSGNAVRLVMDRDVYTAPYFACHPCDNTQSLKFKTEDLLNVLLPKIGQEPIIVEL